MGYMTDGLTFNNLRQANMMRVGVFKNRHGGPAHSKPDGSDWSPAQWLQAVIGELGEYANIRKKYERGDMTLEEYTAAAADELADVQTYLDLLAARALDSRDGSAHPTGIDLGRATMDKWNRVSDRVDANLVLDADGWHYKRAPGVAPPIGIPLEDIHQGMRVIFVPYHADSIDHADAEHGIVKSKNHRYAFVNFHSGDTAAACDPARLVKR